MHRPPASDSSNSAVIESHSPSEGYAELVASGRLVFDPAQAELARQFDALRSQLVEAHRDTGLLAKVRGLLGKSDAGVLGLYVWGGVGRGKTLMMDLFFASLGAMPRQRLHFHRLMQRIHRELADLTGRRDPLQFLAKKLAGEARVLCVDEFYVTDIGDAMILAELLEALFAQGITLVATSNLKPTSLYENGLQRRRFLPAIDLLQAHTRVVETRPGEDFRMRLLKDAGSYHTPLDAGADAQMQRSFEMLADDESLRDVKLEILNRIIRARRVAGGIAMFDFHDLCETARSQNDYIELSRLFHTMLLCNVPVMGERSENAARRFIALVDELYDRSVNLIVSAAVPAHSLYAGERHRQEFERCQSRLIEMRSIEYMERMHKG